MKTMQELLRTAVSRSGTRVAFMEPVGDGDMVSLTYNDLLKQALGFAGALQEKGIQKGDRLLIWSVSRIDWIVAFLGAMLIGAVVVPLDINSKEDFLSKIEQSTEAKFLITSQNQYGGLKQSHAPLIDIDTLPQSTMDMAALPEIFADDLAEIVFTSGTTGQPKGVMLSHYNIMRVWFWYHKPFNFFSMGLSGKSDDKRKRNNGISCIVSRNSSHFSSGMCSLARCISALAGTFTFL